MSEETDPNLLYKIETKLLEFNLFDVESINAFAKIFYNPNEAKEKLQGVLDVVADKFREIDKEKKKEFRLNIISFIRTYGFLSQIISFQDINLEKLYIFLINLNKKLPYIETEKINIESYIDIEFFKIQKKFEGKIELDDKNEIVDPIENVGVSSPDDTQDSLLNIIKEINDRFHSDFSSEDKINFEIIRNKIWKNSEWLNVKTSDATETNKRLIFRKIFEKALIDTADENLPFYEKFSTDDKKRFFQDKLYNELIK